jgi:hypothetical protein
MKTISVPSRFLTFNDEGKPDKIDMIGFLNSLPEKQKLDIVIRSLKHIQEEQYQGAKKFLDNTPCSNKDYFKHVYEAMGRMYYVLHSIEDDYNKL